MSIQKVLDILGLFLWGEVKHLKPHANICRGALENEVGLK